MSISEAKKQHEKAMSNLLEELKEVAQKEPANSESLFLIIKKMETLCKAHGEILRLSCVLAFELLPRYREVFEGFKDETIINCIKALMRNFYIIWKKPNE